jgi:hypothetical protein
VTILGQLCAQKKAVSTPVEYDEHMGMRTEWITPFDGQPHALSRDCASSGCSPSSQISTLEAPPLAANGE